MRRTFYEKYISFLMVVVMITISLTGIYRSAVTTGYAGDVKYGQCAGSPSPIEKACPSCPIDDHSVPDHCDSSCYNPCHAPFTAQPVQIVCLQLISPLEFYEPFKALPEVYLPKFILPHILA